ncbi:surface glycoprotein (TIGR04207 family) [Halorubrum alkaliphilum]|uniref:Surface glycoprotein (TIGR04207 family) n=1 Tax=Halorubrum alkaliphilum TaxID=261290 RepID=A0A8T4GKW8_9EURY|nr:right-handed parallel beta-helix repeat-containing protein [Halorubrum alkaliphilum]MBP1923652.1 surface glycoprotein (TIGR04207 family) [Halorubrum alkaliphilum]
MSGRKQKIRAAFLSMIMVLSVVAMAGAFAGSAAATPQNVDLVDVDPDEVVQDQTVDHEIETFADEIDVDTGEVASSIDVRIEVTLSDGEFDSAPAEEDVTLTSGGDTVEGTDAAVDDISLQAGESTLRVDYDSDVSGGDITGGSEDITLTVDSVDIDHADNTDDVDITVSYEDNDGPSDQVFVGAINVLANDGVSIDNAGTPADIAAGDDDVTQDLAAEEDIEITVPEDGDRTQVRYDLNTLTDLGVDISEAELGDYSATGDTIIDSNVDEDDETLRFVVEQDGSEIEFSQLELDGLDTSDVSTQTGLDYRVTIDYQNLDVFADFDTDDVARTGTFNLAFIEVENLAQEDREVFTNVNDALTSNLHDNDEDVVIRFAGGTYEFSGETIGADNDQLEIRPVENDDVTFLTDEGAPDTTFDVDAEDVTIFNVTFDQNEETEIALNLLDEADLSVEDSTFEGMDGSEDYIVSQEGADLDIDGSTFEGEDEAESAVSVGTTGDEGSLSVTDSTLNETDTALDLSEDLSDIDAITVENNEFNANDFHIDDDGDNIDLDAAFDDNTFDQYVIVEDIADEIIDGIYGDLDTAVDEDTADDLDEETVTITGEHELDGSTINIAGSADDVVITSPTDVDAEDVEIIGDSDTDVIVIDDGVDDLEVSGLTILADDGGSDARAITDGGTNEIRDLVISDNVFVLEGDDDVAAIDLDQSNDVIDVEIDSNTFEPEDEGDEYDAINIDVLEDDGSASADITNNVIESADNGLTTGAIDADDLSIEVSGNSLLNVTAASGDGIQFDVEDGIDSLEVSNNHIAGDEDGSDATGIDLALDDQSEDVDVSANTVVGLDEGTALVLDDDEAEPAPTVEDNVFDNNEEHIDFTSAENEVDDLLEDNTFETMLIVTEEVDDFDDAVEDGDLREDTIFGLLAGVEGVPSTGDGDYVFVGAGEYVEADDGAEVIDVTESEVTFESLEGAEETGIVNEHEQDTIVLSSGADEVVIDGFTFDSQDAGDEVDILVEDTSVSDAQILNSEFIGPGDDADRTAVEFKGDGSDTQLNNSAIDQYETGILVDGHDGSSDLLIVDTDINGTDTGVDVTDVDVDEALEIVDGSVTYTDTGIVAADDDQITVNGTVIEVEDVGVQMDGADLDVENAEITTEAIDGLGVHVNGDHNNLDVSDSVVYDNDVAVQLDDGDNHVLVRNQILNSTETGVYIDGSVGGETRVNFNDIVDNEVGIEDNDGLDDQGALANWYGDETGPSGEASGDEFTGSGDEVDADVNAEYFVPWLNQSVTELPEDELIVVTDERNIFAEDNGYDFPEDDRAQLVVAVLDDDLAGDIDVSEDLTTLTDIDDVDFDDDPEYLEDDEVSADNPLLELDANVDDDAPGDYDIEVLNTGDAAVSDGFGVQTFIATADGVEVTAESDEVVADGETTTNITAQLTADGEPVAQGGEEVTFQIINTDEDAGAALTETSVDTDSDGQAVTGLTAEEAGFDITVRAIAVNSQDSVTVTSVEPTEANFTLSDLDAPDQIVQNESYEVSVNVTNEGDGVGTQDVVYELQNATDDTVEIDATEADVELDAGNSTEVTFEVAAEDTDALELGDDYAHVFETDDDTLTIENVSVVEELDDPRAAYTNEDGVVDGDGLLDAAADFRQDDIDSDLLLDVAAAFRTDEVIQ